MFVAILGAGGSLMDMAPKFRNYSSSIQLKTWSFFADILVSFKSAGLKMIQLVVPKFTMSETIIFYYS